MAIFDLFSKRQKRLRGEVPDIFKYNEIPNELRVQIIHIWRDAIGEDRSRHFTPASDLYKELHDILCREYGIFSLIPNSRSDYSMDLGNYFLNCEENEKVLDVVELVFKGIELVTTTGSYEGFATRKISSQAAIEELNARFLEHGIGYHFESGMLIRKDSEFIHTEVVKPTLLFLQSKLYKGANEEFLKAHEHYRHGKYKECLNECLKAFESTMKAICEKRKWAYNQNDTAKKLIERCFNNALVPSFIQSEITALRSVLESGIPTVRNRLGGHGQGAQQTIVPAHLASYTLHMTASTILFLVEAEKSLP